MIKGLFILTVCIPEPNPWIDKPLMVKLSLGELLRVEVRSSISSVRVIDSVSVYDDLMNKASYDYLPFELSERFPFRLLD